MTTRQEGSTLIGLMIILLITVGAGVSFLISFKNEQKALTANREQSNFVDIIRYLEKKVDCVKTFGVEPNEGQAPQLCNQNDGKLTITDYTDATLIHQNGTTIAGHKVRISCISQTGTATGKTLKIEVTHRNSDDYIKINPTNYRFCETYF